MEFMKKKDKNIKIEIPLDGEIKVSESINTNNDAIITDTTQLDKEPDNKPETKEVNQKKLSKSERRLLKRI